MIVFKLIALHSPSFTQAILILLQLLYVFYAPFYLPFKYKYENRVTYTQTLRLSYIIFFCFFVFLCFFPSFFILFGFSFTRNYLPFVNMYRFHCVRVALSFTENCAQIKPNTHRKKGKYTKILKFSDSLVCVALLFLWWTMNRKYT